MQHSFLQKFSVFTQYHILESEEVCISFLQQHEVIPKKEDTPPLCRECSSIMRMYPNKEWKFGWAWTCRNTKLCFQFVNSLKGTLFEKIKLRFRDVMVFIFSIILSINLTDIHAEIVRWRALRSEYSASMDTSRQLYNTLAEVARTALAENGEEVLGTVDAIFDKYRETRLNCHGSYDDKLQQFLMDIKYVYPGY